MKPSEVSRLAVSCSAKGPLSVGGAEMLLEGAVAAGADAAR